MRTSRIEDVAAAAGVSVATVSRALRGLPHVAAGTRARVEAAAVRLKYAPNPAASRLAAGRSTTVAMVVPSLSSWYFAKATAGAESVLSQAGYDLLVVVVDSPESRERVLGGPLIKRADGLIACDVSLTGEQSAALIEQGVRLVSIGREFQASRSVLVDDQHIARCATEHLIDLGHDRIGLLFGRDGDQFVVPDARREGFRSALEASGLIDDPSLTATGTFSVTGGASAMRELLALDDPPTAVFAMSDEMAFGAMQAAAEAGRSIPHDLSIVGVDNHEFAAVVGLTTMDQDVASHGIIAAELLLDSLTGASESSTSWSPQTRLVRRTSTAAAPR